MQDEQLLISSICVNGIETIQQDQIQTYQIIECIGSGAFSKCFKIKPFKIQKQSHRNVYAAKCFSKKTINTQRQICQLIQQIKIGISAIHQHIVQCLKTVQSHLNIYVLMEFCQKNLSKYLQENQKIQTKDAYRIFYQLALAVEYLHDRRILHRDLKPENILLTKDNDVKLADFGISKFFPRQKKQIAKGIAGTREYMAPQVLKEDQYSYPADIWSMGVILYILLTGEKPYNINSKEDLSKKIEILGQFSSDITKSPCILSKKHIDSAAQKLLRKIFQQDAKKRPTIKDIVNQEFLKQCGCQKTNQSQKNQNTNNANSQKQETKQNIQHIEKQLVYQRTQTINQSQILISTRTSYEDNQKFILSENKFKSNQKDVFIRKFFYKKNLAEQKKSNININANYSHSKHCYLLTNNHFGVWFKDDSQIISTCDSEYYFIINYSQNNLNEKPMIQMFYKTHENFVKHQKSTNDDKKLAQKYATFNQLRNNFLPKNHKHDKNCHQSINYDSLSHEFIQQFYTYPTTIKKFITQSFVIMSTGNYQGYFSHPISLRYILDGDKSKQVFIDDQNGQETLKIKINEKKQKREKIKRMTQ